MTRKFNMKITFFFSFFFLTLTLSFLKSYAQLDIKAPKDFTIHSPNATSLGEYTSYPVDLSTGVPQISIPLYTVSSGKISIPISLSYHASGIKVDQEASFVGLGWVLNAGGLITRTLKDKIDENSDGFRYTGQSLPDFNSITNINGAGGISNSPALKTQFELKDNEPDIFNAIAPGLNDEFCYDNQGKLVSTHLDPLKYTADFGANLITITDRAGNMYRFGRGLDNSEAFETISSSSQSTSSATPYNFYPYVSSWYLTEIISADLADTISFKYQTRIFTDSKVVNSVRYIINDDMLTGPVDKTGSIFDGLYHTSMSKTIGNMRVLDKIIFKNGSVEFTSVSDRLDIRDGAPSSTIGPGTRNTGFNIYDTKRNLIRSIVFDNNNYFDRTGIGSDIRGYTIDAIRKKSLKLNGVKFFDKNHVFNNEYKFQYDETPLPPMNTTSQDFWGYYNGKSNSTLIPQTFFKSRQGLPEYYGDDRKSNINFMKAASLKQITFPTGGYTSYEYEPHYYLSQHASQGQIEVPQSVNIYAINRLASCRPNYLPGVPMNNSVDFQVTNLANSVANLYVMFSDFAVSSFGYSMTFDLWEISDTGGLVTLIRHFERPPSSNTQPLVFNNIQFSVYEGRKYRMIANTNGVTGSNVSLCNSPYIEAGVSYTSLQSTSDSGVNVEQAGGLRVKTITNYNNDNTLISKKAFEYGTGVYGAGGVGVGKLITDPSHNFYNFPVLYFDASSNATLKNVLWFTSNSQVELGMNSGCPVDYDKVTVKDISVDQKTDGKTEYYYHSMDGYHDPKSSFMYPYEFIVRPFWTVNNLVKTIHYTGTESNNYVPVKKVEDQYYMIETRIKTFKIFEYQPDIYNAWNWGAGYLMDNPNRFYRYNYFQGRGKALKIMETVTEYGNAGSDNLVTEKQYQYNPYYDLKQETYTDNQSRTVQTNYKYTGDIDYTNLIAKNAVSLPIQTEQVVAGKVRNGSIFKYNDLTQLTDQYTALTNSTPIAYTSSATIPTSYEKDKSYEYDSDHKNLKTVTPNGGLPVVYIWSYNGQYPVAEIKGATYASIETALGGATAVSNFRKSMPTDAQVNSFLSTLRTSITGAQVATYTYTTSVGITSSTDAKGLTMYYEYDDFQRLVNIKDKDGNILKHTDYHYQGQ